MSDPAPALSGVSNRPLQLGLAALGVMVLLLLVVSAQPSAGQRRVTALLGARGQDTVQQASRVEAFRVGLLTDLKARDAKEKQLLGPGSEDELAAYQEARRGLLELQHDLREKVAVAGGKQAQAQGSGPGPKLRGFDVTAGPQALAPDVARQLAQTLVDPATYRFQEADPAAFRPEVALRFSEGDATVEVLISFAADKLRIYSADGGGTTERFERAALLPLIKPLFPNDPELQALR